MRLSARDVQSNARRAPLLRLGDALRHWGCPLATACKERITHQDPVNIKEQTWLALLHNDSRDGARLDSRPEADQPSGPVRSVVGHTLDRCAFRGIEHVGEPLVEPYLQLIHE